MLTPGDWAILDYLVGVHEVNNRALLSAWKNREYNRAGKHLIINEFLVGQLIAFDRVINDIKREAQYDEKRLDDWEDKF